MFFTIIASPDFMLGSILSETITNVFIPKKLGVSSGFVNDFIISVMLYIIIGTIIIIKIILIICINLCIFSPDLLKSFILYNFKNLL